MDTADIIQSIKSIEVESPTNKIIQQLKQLIVSGQLKPGDRLPAERVLAEKLGVGRSYVREAIRKLEFFGLLKTSPQSGTYVSGYSIKMIEGVLTDIINFNKDDFSALIEARYYMEINAARLAAMRRTEEDLVLLRSAVEDYDNKVNSHQDAIQEDMFIHLRIANATRNSVFESMLLMLLPDIIRNIIEKKICGDNRGLKAVAEHHEILQAIADQDADAAAAAMAAHLDDIFRISRER
ncbi:GntR family transcriptional regulator [Niastella yeongjuensis]|uniref:GntR family transcriptional regulator n=1 Tax=Niastella yeongjuensis TaxID=354355 RepID=A0A1V9EMS7_9BACT|nr:FadR/GntR family transcriptional regulator [Niastella yeongjuensis]OQP47439.1 GntR family transcriptional regulator [Niastella yeongjuensis]SEN84270.1 GntR family transcriptional regulator, transcriptional repressor for pyruvate dehydrogenase complex [Niastella yeongjuensis]